MGGSQSKAAILERYGSLLQDREKECVSTCFNNIATSPDAVHVSKDQVMVSKDKSSMTMDLCIEVRVQQRNRDIA